MIPTLGYLEGLAAEYGYPGVFAISLAGSAIPFVPLPYLAVVVLLSSTNDPLLLGFVAGVGGALGELTSYALGRMGYLASGKQSRRDLEAIQGIVSKYGTLGVFLFAVTPLPDDIYVIPMGVVKLPFWRFLAADLAGKIVLSVSVAYLGSAYLSALDSFIGVESIPAIVLAVIVTAVLSVAAARCDWILAVEVAREKGARGVLLNLRAILRLGSGGKEGNDAPTREP